LQKHWKILWIDILHKKVSGLVNNYFKSLQEKKFEKKEEEIKFLDENVAKKEVIILESGL
jgi:hypothetical protein